MNAFPTKNFQQGFFDELELQFPKRGQMVNAISEILNIGRDAVYRRLRGDTVLAADELIILARKFGISLDGDTKIEPQEKVLTYPAGVWQVKTELQYFQQLEVQCLRLKGLSGVEIDYATPELPFYFELLNPTLLAFKIYVYGLTTWNFSKWKGQEFRIELIDPKVFEITERLTDILFSMPGREVWSVGIMDLTLRQIEHAVDVGALVDTELINRMFAEIEQTITHMEAMTMSGKRFPPGKPVPEVATNFKVYHNELTNTSNLFIVKSDEYSFVYSAFINPNFVFSIDEQVVESTEKWFDNLIESSNVLTTQSTKYAQKFFRHLRRTVAITRQRVDAMLLIN